MNASSVVNPDSGWLLAITAVIANILKARVVRRTLLVVRRFGRTSAAIAFLFGISIFARTENPVDVCELAKHPETFLARTITISTTIWYMASDVVIYRSDIRADIDTKCKIADRLDLIFENDRDPTTAEFLHAVQEMVPQPIDGGKCYCIDCPKYRVSADLEVEVVKWKKPPPIIAKDGWLIEVVGEEPKYQLLVKRVVRYSANEVAINCND